MPPTNCNTEENLFKTLKVPGGAKPYNNLRALAASIPKIVNSSLDEVKNSARYSIEFPPNSVYLENPFRKPMFFSPSLFISLARLCIRAVLLLKLLTFSPALFSVSPYSLTFNPLRIKPSPLLFNSIPNSSWAFVKVRTVEAELAIDLL